jgi:hypothetical protein
MSQYLGDKELSILATKVDINELGTSDSYNEALIIEKIKTMTKEDIILLGKAAIHIAVIGAGGKSFGYLKLKEGNLEITKIFDKVGILYKNTQNAKLKEDDISSRRIVRLYRYQIRNFISTSGRASYLWQKYSSQDEKYKNVCFPGAEHLINDKDEANYLLATYKKLDEVHGTTFTQRIKNVFLARNIKFDE